MACDHPKFAWTMADGRTTIQPQKRTPDTLWKCNKCPGCISDKKRDWANRIAHELSMQPTGCFITLTYDDQHLGENKLNKDHMSEWMQTMRDKFGKMRFFYSGEYGPKTGRAHYHAIIFGHNFLEILTGADRLNDRDGLYNAKYMDHLWGRGQCFYGPAQPGSARYIAGYVEKKIGDTDTLSSMSKRPPIGIPWLLKNKRQLLKGYIGYIDLNGEYVKTAIPEAYKKWLRKNDPELHEQVKEVLKDQIKFEHDRVLANRALTRAAKSKLFNKESI